MVTAVPSDTIASDPAMVTWMPLDAEIGREPGKVTVAAAANWAVEPSGWPIVVPTGMVIAVPSGSVRDAPAEREMLVPSRRAPVSLAVSVARVLLGITARG